MDRRVKERLVGATILGVLIVLLVPELLSGPKPAAEATANPAEPVRNVTVDLTTRQSVMPTAAPPTQPPTPAEPESAGSANMPPPAPPAAAQSAAADAPVPLESPSSSPISTGSETGHRGWALQVGSFASRDNADKLARELKARGLSAYVVSSGSGATIRHKVRIGPLADRTAAERLLAKLKTQKYSPRIVVPDSRQ